jgi:hypothetical protein
MIIYSTRLYKFTVSDKKNAAAERRKTAAAQEDKIMEEILHFYNKTSGRGLQKKEIFSRGGPFKVSR